MWKQVEFERERAELRRMRRRLRSGLARILARIQERRKKGKAALRRWRRLRGITTRTVTKN